MKLGRVIGNITATVQHAFYDNRKLLVVELEGGGQMIAIDTVQSGLGDRVLILDEGNGARQVLDDKSAPVRSVIVGVVDVVTADG